MKSQFIKAVENLILLAGFQPEPNERVITIGDAVVFKLGNAYLAFTDVKEELLKFTTPEFLQYVALLPSQTVLVLGDIKKSEEIKEAMATYFTHETLPATLSEASAPDPEPVNPNAHPFADVIKAWADDTTLPVQYRRTSEIEWTSLNEAGVKPTFNPSFEWRITPPQHEEIHIPWDIVDPAYNYAAMDENGNWCFYTTEPYIIPDTLKGAGAWDAEDYVGSLLKLDTAKDYRLSLQKRNK